jgi:predicted phosphodiesterase
MEDQLKDGGDLVLLGDIIDFWRRDFAKALMESERAIDILTKIKRANVHYVAGNHDFYMLRLKEALATRFPFDTVDRSIKLHEGGRKFFFIHGYQLETLANPYYKSLTSYERFAEGLCLAGDDLGNAADKLCETIKTTKSVLDGLKRLPADVAGALSSMMDPADKRLRGPHQAGALIETLSRSPARSVYLGTERDEVLVFGHTHQPFNDSQNNVVNTGSWNKSPNDRYCYLEIDGGEIKPRIFR